MGETSRFVYLSADDVEGNIPFRRPLRADEEEEVLEAGRSLATVSGVHNWLLMVGNLGREAQTGTRTEDAAGMLCERRFRPPPSADDKPRSSPDGGNKINKIESLGVVLDTTGGSLDSAFKTVIFLKRFAKSLKVYVPYRAQSAGTLIAIGADELHMSPIAELGPLDAQIVDPRNPMRPISALDCYQSVGYVRDFGLKTVTVALKKFFEVKEAKSSAVSVPELFKMASAFGVRNVNPMLVDSNALDFGAWGRQLEIAEKYAGRLLAKVGYSEEEIREIPRKLVYDYTHHMFPIDLDEAKDRLHLRTVQRMTEKEYTVSAWMASRCRRLPGGSLVAWVDGEKTGDGESPLDWLSTPREDNWARRYDNAALDPAKGAQASAPPPGPPTAPPPPELLSTSSPMDNGDRADRTGRVKGSRRWTRFPPGRRAPSSTSQRGA